MADLKKFAEDLVNLTVKEVNELAEILKTEYGIEPAAAAVAVAVVVVAVKTRIALVDAYLVDLRKAACLFRRLFCLWITNVYSGD